ncbi:38771_t:CDS:2, partial [Gigaspora margarita]
MPETSKLEESKSDNELQDETTNDNDNVALLLEDLSAETNLVVQELSNNIEEYIQMIDQLAATEDILTDEGIIKMVMDEFHDKETNNDDNNEEPLPSPITITKPVEALKKVIRFNENGLIMLRKKLKEWQYEKDKSKKQTSILSFFNKP